MEKNQAAQLELINISKVYPGNITVLDDVSFQLHQGEFAFLVGESGAGKSTIVKILIREEEPTSGKVLLNGENILEVPKKEIHLVRRKIGVVFQDFKLLDSKTVYENVAIALEVADTSQEEMREIIPNVLEMVRLADKKNHLPYQLSGGERQRVSIARALAHEPDILVADEPTGMIDPNSGENIVEILDQINQRGTTVLMATHDRSIVNSWKKRVIRLASGKIVSDKEKGQYDE
jgi:cell division transport system ATP-binding protein